MKQTKFNTSNPIGAKLAQECLDDFKNIGAIVEIKKETKKRSSAQNRALWKWLTQIADLLNEYGLTYYSKTIIGDADVMYNKDIVYKEIFISIINTLYGYSSSTKMKTNQFDDAIDVMSKLLAEYGIVAEFPCWEQMLMKEQ